MVDTGATVNLMPYSLCHKLGRMTEDLIKTNIMLNDYEGSASQAHGVFNAKLTIGNKTVNTFFFVIDSQGPYSALLGRDWIHTNCCVPSTIHQCLIQWDGNDVEVIPADDSFDVAMDETYFWAASDTECLTGREDQDCEFIEASKNGVTLVPATGVYIYKDVS